MTHHLKTYQGRSQPYPSTGASLNTVSFSFRFSDFRPHNISKIFRFLADFFSFKFSSRFFLSEGQSTSLPVKIETYFVRVKVYLLSYFSYLLFHPKEWEAVPRISLLAYSVHACVTHTHKTHWILHAQKSMKNTGRHYFFRSPWIDWSGT